MLTAASIELKTRPHPTTAAPRAMAESTGQFTLRERVERTLLRKFAAKDSIFSEGELRTHVFQIEDGVAKIYRMLPDGRRQVADFAYAGDFIGLGTTGAYTFSAEAMGQAKVRCIPAAALEEAAHHDPDLALALYKAVSLELSSARALLMAIGQRSAIERVGSFLVMLYRRQAAVVGAGHAAVIDLPMRRADIADLLGLTIETVSRTITKLRGMRVIEVTHGTSIRILDVDRLEELAETD